MLKEWLDCFQAQFFVSNFRHFRTIQWYVIGKVVRIHCNICCHQLTKSVLVERFYCHLATLLLRIWLVLLSLDEACFKCDYCDSARFARAGERTDGNANDTLAFNHGKFRRAVSYRPAVISCIFCDKLFSKTSVGRIESFEWDAGRRPELHGLTTRTSGTVLYHDHSQYVSWRPVVAPLHNPPPPGYTMQYNTWITQTMWGIVRSRVDFSDQMRFLYPQLLILLRMDAFSQ